CSDSNSGRIRLKNFKPCKSCAVSLGSVAAARPGLGASTASVDASGTDLLRRLGTGLGTGLLATCQTGGTPAVEWLLAQTVCQCRSLVCAQLSCRTVLLLTLFPFSHLSV